ncbi:MAG: UDP-N-acetylmuramate dehydrogenase [Firmicutes bacterium]|nr:UDP-N-acetylmuramate dehydrogenase [Bacillota bacterium]
MLEKLGELVPAERIKYNEPMSRHTTFAIGGPADALVTPGSEEELARLIIFAREHRLPLLVIGLGSNLLVKDGGVRGLVVKIDRGLGQVEFRSDRMRAGAGIPLAELSKMAAGESLSGLEFAVGIPGSLGGALVMNAGAYGGEMKDVVESVRAIDQQGEVLELDAGQLDYGYRHSSLQGSGLVVVSADLKLKAGDPAEIKARMQEYTERRQAVQPLELPSAGSVFRRPPGKYVGPMIEGLGLKGFNVGDAQVSEKHAGFIVNRGQATAGDVLGLIEIIQQVVQEHCGVRLEPEIQVVGEDLVGKQAFKNMLSAKGFNL